jgi:hypothetical protein
MSDTNTTLTRDGIIDMLVERHKLRRREAVDLFDTFIQDTKDEVNRDNTARWPGFGRFKIKKQYYKLKSSDISEDDRPNWRVITLTPYRQLHARIDRAVYEESKDID